MWQASPIFRRTGRILFFFSLFCIGIWHWVYFFYGGHFSLAAVASVGDTDWAKEFIYLDVLRHAITTGAMPYHMSYVCQHTNRFLGIPETLLSPQIFLLPYVTNSLFVLLNTILMYAIGFIGCIMLAKRYRFSNFTFAAFFVLFNFNGYITSHLSVGHTVWTAYFLMPFFCLAVLKIIEKHPMQLEDTLPISFILFVMFMQGGIRFFLWCSIFLFILALSYRPLRRHVLFALTAGMILSAVRILPAALTFYQWKKKFIGGYSSVTDLLSRLTVLQGNQNPATPIFAAGTWELDIFIGVFGLLFILYFGIFARRRLSAIHPWISYRPLDIPLIAIGLLSMSYFYAPIFYSPIPLCNSERVVSRFIAVPFMFILCISCIRLQKFLESSGILKRFRLLLWVALLEVSLELFTHSALWRPLLSALPDFPVIPVEIITQNDPLYKTGVAISFWISLFALFVAGWMYLHRPAAQEEKENSPYAAS